MWCYRSTIRLLAPTAATLLAVACASGTSEPTAYERLRSGSITYPFAKSPQSLGKEPPAEKFVIRSAVGQREYTVEIPGAARDYDVAVPLAELGGAAEGASGKDDVGNPAKTDGEMVASLPQISEKRPGETQVMDRAFGVGPKGGPRQAPSYTLGIAKVNEHFKKRNYEYALIEINNLLSFYPNSPRLHKMKGTVLLKMRNYQLAERAWLKALKIDPSDKKLGKAVERLQERMVATGKAAEGTNLQKPADIPEPVGTANEAGEAVLGH